MPKCEKPISIKSRGKKSKNIRTKVKKAIDIKSKVKKSNGIKAKVKKSKPKTTNGNMSLYELPFDEKSVDDIPKGGKSKKKKTKAITSKLGKSKRKISNGYVSLYKLQPEEESISNSKLSKHELLNGEMSPDDISNGKRTKSKKSNRMKSYCEKSNCKTSKGETLESRHLNAGILRNWSPDTKISKGKISKGNKTKCKKVLDMVFPEDRSDIKAPNVPKVKKFKSLKRSRGKMSKSERLNTETSGKRRKISKKHTKDDWEAFETSVLRLINKEYYS